MSGVNPPAPPRDPRLVALEQRFRQVKHIDVLLHCLGLQRLPGIPNIANGIADHIIVVCIDCEHWSINSDETTEIGIGRFFMQDMLRVRGNLGDHGENMMRCIKFNLLRTIENSHLPTTHKESKGPEGNHFGQARFVTFAQARQILQNVFAQPITGVQELQGCNHPIVVLGQDVGHDKNNLKHKDVAFDLEALGTVVRVIDTQVLARDVGFWMVPHEQIGLKTLVDKLFFKHTDPHTAANDAGRCLIAAFQLALQKHQCKKNAQKTMLDVAEAIENYSQVNFQSIGGTQFYCWRCGAHDHMKWNCRTPAASIRCDECWSHGRILKDEDKHITLHCMHVSQEKAAARRARHAQAKAMRLKNQASTGPHSRQPNNDRARFPGQGPPRQVAPPGPVQNPYGQPQGPVPPQNFPYSPQGQYGPAPTGHGTYVPPYPAFPVNGPPPPSGPFGPPSGYYPPGYPGPAYPAASSSDMSGPPQGGRGPSGGDYWGNAPAGAYGQGGRYGRGG